MTNEPGIYFNKLLLEDALKDEKITNFFKWDKIKEYMIIGGIRIEDDFVVTKDGYDILSKDLPKTIKEIEDFMKK